MWTLLHLKYRKHVIAGDAENGSSNQKKGADGKDVVLDVPLGTVIKDASTNNVEQEITNTTEFSWQTSRVDVLEPPSVFDFGSIAW